MSCLAKKEKTNPKTKPPSSKSAPKAPTKEPLTPLAPQEQETNGNPQEFRKQPSFYGVYDNIVPKKCDYVIIERNDAPHSHNRYRFVILTDSVLICFDEVNNNKTGLIEFEKTTTQMSRSTVTKGKDLSIEVEESSNNTKL
jgi:hypothetical protein